MPFNPAVQPRQDQFIYQGLANTGSILSESLVKTLQKLDEEKKQKAFGDMVIGQLAHTKGSDGQPYVPVDALLRYEKGGSSQRAGIVQGALANAQLDMERAKTSQQADLDRAHADYLRAQAASAGADDSQPFSPVTDANGKTIPGQIYVKKTGAIHDVSDVGGAPVLSQDGKFYLERKTNSWKPLPAATMVLPGMQAGGASPAAAPAAGATTFPAAGGGAGKVKVVSPKGEVGMIPAERLPDYLAAGYTQG